MFVNHLHREKEKCDSGICIKDISLHKSITHKKSNIFKQLSLNFNRNTRMPQFTIKVHSSQIADLYIMGTSHKL